MIHRFVFTVTGKTDAEILNHATNVAKIYSYSWVIDEIVVSPLVGAYGYVEPVMWTAEVHGHVEEQT